MIAMTNEEILFHIKKIVDKWDRRFEEETGGFPVLEERRIWMWEECVKEIRPLLDEMQ